MGAKLGVFIDRIARTGQVTFVDDDVEQMTMMQVKLRRSERGESSEV